MRLIFRSLLILCLLSPVRRAIADTPFDVIEHAYAPYFDANDELALPVKIKSLAADPYKFWRGSKDLFFIWCKANAADWLADADSFVPCHGDLHLGNIGSYACDEGFGKLAFGMVDFDDADVMPFQIELLSGVVTLRLVAQQNGIAIDPQTTGTLLDSYRKALGSSESATRLLRDDPIVSELFRKQGSPYADEIERYTQGGRLRSLIKSKKDEVREILRPAMDRADGLAAALAEAMKNDPRTAQLCRLSKTSEFRGAIKDIAQRTRLGSSGSQGLKKYLVLLERPLTGIDHDVIFYLKQEIPSAGQRSGAQQPDKEPAAHHVSQLADRLTSPHLYLSSWCRMGAESYVLSLKEPWSGELDPNDVKSPSDLIHIARIWGTVAGAAHGSSGKSSQIRDRLTNDLASQLDQRAIACVAQIDADFTQLRADPRVKELSAAAQSAIKHLTDDR